MFLGCAILILKTRFHSVILRRRQGQEKPGDAISPAAVGRNAVLPFGKRPDNAFHRLTRRGTSDLVTPLAPPIFSFLRRYLHAPCFREAFGKEAWPCRTSPSASENFPVHNLVGKR